MAYNSQKAFLIPIESLSIQFFYIGVLISRGPPHQKYNKAADGPLQHEYLLKTLNPTSNSKRTRSKVDNKLQVQQQIVLDILMVSKFQQTFFVWDFVDLNLRLGLG
eukprot:TRINITY_DN9323_c0_g1_i1.p12 TRINITY_DN9323_c0_g1~~TRINITY_DN9323_c0_g1_i1.p12  ORF type:complete len:106 (+),score=4.75 TRINITY_DN9323_c0_g1_i1:1287-1604(+)